MQLQVHPSKVLATWDHRGNKWTAPTNHHYNKSDTTPRRACATTPLRKWIGDQTMANRLMATDWKQVKRCNGNVISLALPTEQGEGGSDNDEPMIQAWKQTRRSEITNNRNWLRRMNWPSRETTIAMGEDGANDGLIRTAIPTCTTKTTSNERSKRIATQRRNQRTRELQYWIPYSLSAIIWWGCRRMNKDATRTRARRSGAVPLTTKLGSSDRLIVRMVVQPPRVHPPVETFLFTTTPV